MQEDCYMSSRFLRSLSLAFLPSVIMLTMVGCGQAGSSKANVVATYQGGSVTETDLNKYLGVLSLVNPQANTSTTAAKTQVLNQYIVVDKLLAKQAAQAGFTPDSSTVQKETSQFKSQVVQQLYNNSTQSFDQKMKSLNLTDADVTQVIGNELAVQSYAASLIPASDLQTYYNQHLSNFTYTTQHGILVKTKAEADKIYGLLKADDSTANWNKLATQYSQDPGSKDNGGLYSNQPASNWVPEYAKAVTTQPIGKVGQPFNTTYGWFVVEVVNRKVEPFNTVKQTVQGQILNDSSSKYAFSNLVTQAEQKADIKVSLPSSSTNSTSTNGAAGNSSATNGSSSNSG
jgi:PPIC-type PPIASE domain